MALCGAVHGVKAALQLFDKLGGVVPGRKGRQKRRQLEESLEVLVADFDGLQCKHNKVVRANQLLLQRCRWLKLHLHASRSRRSKLSLVDVQLKMCKKQLQSVIQELVSTKQQAVCSTATCTTLSHEFCSTRAREGLVRGRLHREKRLTALQATVEGQAQQLDVGAAVLVEVQQRLSAAQQDKLQHKVIVDELQQQHSIALKRQARKHNRAVQSVLASCDKLQQQQHDALNASHAAIEQQLQARQKRCDALEDLLATAQLCCNQQQDVISGQKAELLEQQQKCRGLEQEGKQQQRALQQLSMQHSDLLQQHDVLMAKKAVQDQQLQTAQE
eukprot:gene130-301_t